MMAVTWVSFPTAWTLVDVQAVNNIFIQVLCGVGSFTIVRLIWCWVQQLWPGRGMSLYRHS